MPDSEIKKRDDPDFYALQDSKNWENNVQNCLAQFPISKIDRDESIFTDYTVTYGARLYISRDDVSPTNLGEKTFDMTLDPPTYDSSYDPEEYIEYGEIETNWIHLTNTFTEVADTTTNLGVAGTAESGVYIELEINKDYTRPDSINFWFNTVVPEEAISTDDVVFQWVSYTPNGGDTITIGCKTVYGDATQYEVTEWVGTASFASADVSGIALGDLNANTKNDDPSSRPSYQEWDYESTSWENEDGSSKVTQYCKAIVDISKMDDNSAMFTSYTATSGVRIYDPTDMTTF